MKQPRGGRRQRTPAEVLSKEQVEELVRVVAPFLPEVEQAGNDTMLDLLWGALRAFNRRAKVDLNAVLVARMGMDWDVQLLVANGDDSHN